MAPTLKKFWVKNFIPACLDVEKRLFVVTWVISANMNKEIFRSLVEFHFEQFQMSLMVESILKIFKVKDTFQTTIFIRVKQKVLFIQGYFTASTFQTFLGHPYTVLGWSWILLYHREGYQLSYLFGYSVISVENTHNMLGGIPLELDYLMELDNFAKENDAFIHTDGARLINAAISLNIPLDEICQYTDTVRDQLLLCNI